MLSMQFQCSDCGSLHGFRSRPRTAATEKVFALPIFLHSPGAMRQMCFRRDYRLVFLPVSERPQREVTRDQIAA